MKKKHEINEDMKWKVIIPIHKSIKDILSDDPKHSNIRRKKIYLLKFVFAFFFNILAIMLAVVIKSNGGSPQRQSWKIVLFLHSVFKEEQRKRKNNIQYLCISIE